MDCLQEESDAVWLHSAIKSFRIWFHTSRLSVSNRDSITATFICCGPLLYITVMWHLLFGTKIAPCVCVCVTAGVVCVNWRHDKNPMDLVNLMYFSVCVCVYVMSVCLCLSNSGDPCGCTGNPICVLEAQRSTSNAQWCMTHPFGWALFLMPLQLQGKVDLIQLDVSLVLYPQKTFFSSLPKA